MLLGAGRFFRPGTPASDLHGVPLTQQVPGGAAAASRVPDDADGLVHPAAVAGGGRADRDRHDGEDARNLFGAIDTLRIPLEYLAEMFTAGDTGPVRASLDKLAALRSHMRALNLGEEPDPAIASAVGMRPHEIEEMYRLLAIAKYEERYVIPTAAVGDARRLEESALPAGCSLDYDGGPGMGGDGPFGQDSGRRQLPLVSVENFHLLRKRQTSDHADDA